jgi:hypothetical protein
MALRERITLIMGRSYISPLKLLDYIRCTRLLLQPPRRSDDTSPDSILVPVAQTMGQIREPTRGTYLATVIGTK